MEGKVMSRNLLSVITLSVLILCSLPYLVAAGDEACFYCGMKRSAQGHSWMVIEYDDGSSSGFCSLHCASIDLVLHRERTPIRILVADYYRKNLVEAERAHWVIGGAKAGVMTTRAKWAFERKEGAQKFITEYGGEPATLDAALKAAFEDMYSDILLIQKKRRTMHLDKLKADHH
jgi:nitrous oxide reductase accessory protein NosL